jgi:hypothetical protein
MRWRKVKNPRIQPKKGKYSDWKQQVADDCWAQCVYCAIHESRYGGLDNFHVEHHRPKSLSQFAALINSITNLFLSCAICNRFKSNDWPNDPTVDGSVACYPDPSVWDYNDLFRIVQDTFEIEGLNVASCYIVERLYLNRPQLILERRTAAVAQRLAQCENFVEKASAELLSVRDDNRSVPLLARLAMLMADLSRTFRSASSTRPYRLEDVRRPS